jgi:ankyrin repeat protein
VCDLGDLVPMILQRQEDQFQRIVQRAKLATLNRRSSVNGLAPIHFAVLWPAGLRMLLDRNVYVSPEDTYGRQPIHLAVALGISESVQYLLSADCGLFTPPRDRSLLQHALMLPSPQQSEILHLLIPALIERHTRLMDMAVMVLPSFILSKLNLASGQRHEQRAPSIIEALISHGVDIPRALDLDGKSFYYFSVMSENIHLAPKIADAFWNAGFQDIDTPDEKGATPYLQSWYCANFEMVDWFVQRGVSITSEHRDAPLTALHVYAKRLHYPGGAFADDVDAVPTNQNYMEMIQKHLEIPYDNCICECSPRGCSPVKFLLKDHGAYLDFTRKDVVRKWIENVSPPASLLQKYIYECTRWILFDFLGGEHTCCSLAKTCSVEYTVPTVLRTEPLENKWIKRIDKLYRAKTEHLNRCKVDILIPQRESLRTLQDPGIFKTTLDSAMSHYDEMDRPDTMPVENQVFAYINWLLTEKYLDINVSYECEHCND